MLYSAKYNFVYSKTIKTASTSCEAALEYLIREDYASHATYSKLLADGSRIGLRMFRPANDPNYGTKQYSESHQSLLKTKQQITPNQFDSSYKISSIRNPYDRLISHFHFFAGKKNSLDEFVELKQCGRIEEIRRRFRDYLESGESRYTARQHWYIGPDMLIDKFIRREYLREDLIDVLNHLNVPAEISKKILSKIPKFKVSGRSDACLIFVDYFNSQTLEVVNNRYAEWFSFGGYAKYDSLAGFKYCQQNH